MPTENEQTVVLYNTEQLCQQESDSLHVLPLNTLQKIHNTKFNIK